jgi:hypothetical protein
VLATRRVEERLVHGKDLDIRRNLLQRLHDAAEVAA